MHYVKLLCTLALGLVAQSGNAGYANAGYVTDIVIRNNGVVTFRGGTQVAEPCQSSTSTGVWAFDSTNAAGQAKLATALTAYASHKRVFVGGASNCAVAYGIETVDFLQIADP